MTAEKHWERAYAILLQASNKKITELEEKLQIAADAIDLYNRRSNHSCNIEYGNDTGVENCLRCKGIKALEKIK